MVVDYFVAVLVELGHLHNRHGADVVSNLVHVLSNAFTSTLVVLFSQDIGPAVRVEVK